jgi:predicted transcriptional regulator
MNKTERIKQIEQLRAKGLSYGNIANLLGISRQRIHQILSGYDLLLQNSVGATNGWYTQLKDAVLQRDFHQCQLCKSTESLVIHHLDHNDRNNNFSNLITLCHSCHGTLHVKKYAASRYGSTHPSFTCIICNKQFRVKRNQVNRRQKLINLGEKAYLPRFCSKHCQGKWLGVNYGKGRQGQPQKSTIVS